ncbi:MAG: hypothetical protein WKG01_12060 [Kofleriaceae bacterium]
MRLHATGEARERIRTAIEAKHRFVVLDDAGEEPLATVALNHARLEIAGFETLESLDDSDEGRARLVRNLEAITAARSLRDLRSTGLPETAVEVALGRVENGQFIPLAPSGEVLPIGTQLAVRVRNTHPLQKRLYVSVFDIGLAQRIARLTGAYPAGFDLAYGATFTLGQDAFGSLEGLGSGGRAAARDGRAPRRSS